MKMTSVEKNFLNKICAVSGKDMATVRDILRAILMMTTLEVYGNNEEVIIPYLCKLKISYADKITSKGVFTDVSLDAIPNKALIEEVRNVVNGNTTPTENYIKKQIRKNIQNILEIQDIS